MQYIKFTYVDAVTKVSVLKQIASNGPTFPEIVGLEFELALESLYPTDVPIFYGSCPDSSDIDLDGVITIVSQEELITAKQQELAARKAAFQDVTKRQYEKAAQAELDAAAQAAGYENINNAVSYAEEPAVPKFQNDGKAFRAWRSLVWAYAYTILDSVLAGTEEQPTMEDFLSGMPKLELPVATAAA